MKKASFVLIVLINLVMPSEVLSQSNGLACEYNNSMKDKNTSSPKKVLKDSIYAETDSDEVKIRKLRKYCNSMPDIAMGVSPCEILRFPKDVTKVLGDSVPSLTNVYREYFKIKPGFSGVIMLKITIAASGDVTDINIVSSTTNYPEFDNAIKDFVATYKWKPAENWRIKLVGYGDYKRTIPFSFREYMLK